MTNRGSSFGYESSHVLGRRVSIGDIFVKGSVYLYEGCNEDFFYLFFSLLFRYIVIANLVLLDIYIYIKVVITFFHLSLHMLFLFSLYAHASYFIVCNCLFMFHTKMS